MTQFASFAKASAVFLLLGQATLAQGPTPALDRIAVRQNVSTGQYEFYKVNAGATFIPIGNNTV